MATGAGLAEWEQTHGKKKAKCVLTSTGLLMEGLGLYRTSFQMHCPRTFHVHLGDPCVGREAVSGSKQKRDDTQFGD